MRQGEDDAASDLSDWDDERMMKLGDAIAEQFRLRTAGKKGKKKKFVATKEGRERLATHAALEISKKVSPFSMHFASRDCADVASRII